MKNLKSILHAIPVQEVVGQLDVEVVSLCFDSRQVVFGSLFIAVRGVHTDGHLFIDKAIAFGARAVIVEELPVETLDSVVYIVVADSALALGIVAANFYDNPSKKMKLVGVTGTNGKTTVATLLFQLFTELGYHVGLLSTVQNQIGERVIPATHTTPDPIQLNHLLSEMIEEGCDYCFMEVSSHAVVQQRIAGLKFTGAIFTNITHDHLDFHKTFSSYIKAKKKFFDDLDTAAFALTNEDDRNGQVMLQNTFAHKKSYGLHSGADFSARIVESHFDGMLMNIDGHDVWVKLVGGFNAYNLLAVYGAAILLEQETVRVLTAMSVLTGAEGRFETLKAANGVFGIVDYAHTPDAVENVLQTIEKLRNQSQHIITVLGCGGDRDKTKRPEMSQAALRYSDRLIITSDNPRTEDPLTIIKEMEAGVAAEQRSKVLSIADRKEAIRVAYQLAKPGDIIVVAGKGHEKYQEVNGVRHHFDDKEILELTFNEV
ncbi:MULTISPECIES: UDP-N-acetylmuramoyl-L-alanyl-D-glutamate--2,6-diaminopimelate ligase [Sphingobacterium]|jgi:UDP-N-acetylmuramoyl-L-alanyl-D-glutamate--2,6-diaminopimelate ligase|uniref:UDP-N-acetylmuramoyl-L-alanyl-D-glutamate--2, 6-diaminopimelate ligase n=1 Tax=Sphingobacterium TaxID=28453 RepID=UPI00097F4FC3|nr:MULTISPECIES: UDP-N-acetylmuramoyl-L-alanyl-D-glutamate--2,6-diaminopimelate ligase [Sphingobacterium]UPZ36851.1 UDP-N-acetylmuramoyl-L-alanyl-D-glutamate--2,6-diaminopimelate ligase [Sphingobacterium sp. PCS056]UXD68375.1 UDP-N-acetylmuramoyl-L-alanyl-D-glutamate--2,6-diaminopimelate ligase [Sphingobacterium faecium]WGQ16078.1 UDP-N-acetylmuramoyl-L-alanyl-D-glutamate--2,6-diaminopimelate ligase [Sphingobacterium faecium]SJN50588.1 UDP-N-acetylmuramoylalanyl-D-glutamate--2,6-diaminopimelate